MTIALKLRQKVAGQAIKWPKPNIGRIENELQEYERQHGCTRWTVDMPEYLEAGKRKVEREQTKLVQKLHAACTGRWVLFDRLNSNPETLSMSTTQVLGIIY